MNISLIHAVVIFWSGLLLWILAEYSIARVFKKSKSFAGKSTFYRAKKEPKKKRILWFTDTINDLNGVSVTLRNIGWLAHRRGDDIYLVSSLLESEFSKELPPNLINLKPVIHFKVPYYDTLRAKVPAFFAALLMFIKYKPDEVFISTPSFVGTYGLIFAKLFGIRTSSIYHTDFTMLGLKVIGKMNFPLHFCEFYTKWFYRLADKILVPSQQYIEILAKRGLPRAKMDIFYRGIDASIFKPIENAKAIVERKYKIPQGVNLVYSGRVSEDKKMSFLLNSVLPLLEKQSDLNLIIAGSGPMQPELKERFADNKQIHFLGLVPNKELPEIYAASDLLVFPSEIDTFGMAVLEALACGTPALVSDIGGPRTIIRDQLNGYMIPAVDESVWREKINTVCNWARFNTSHYRELSDNARAHVLQNYDFSRILDNYLAIEARPKRRAVRTQLGNIG